MNDFKFSNENWFRTSVVILTVLLLFVSIWSFFRTSPGVDYYNYWVGVQAVRAQKGVNFYEKEKSTQVRESCYRNSLEMNTGPRQKLAAQCWQDYEKKFYNYQSSDDRLHFFISTPFLYTFMSLFVSGDYELDISKFYLIQLACFAFFILIIIHLLKFPFYSILYPAILFSVFYGPFLSDLRVGNVVLMQLAFIALFLVCVHMIRKKELGYVIGGAVLGLMVLFKPNMIFAPMMILAGLMVMKQKKEFFLSLAGMVAGTVLGLLSASIFFSTFKSWFWWFESARNISNLPYVTVKEGNFALSRVTGEMCGQQNLSYVLFIILMAMITGVAFAVMRKNPSRTAETGSPSMNLLMLSIGCLLYLLCAPLVWIHYYVLAIPAFMCLARPMPAIPYVQRTVIYSSALISYCLISFAGRSELTGFPMATSAVLCNAGAVCLLLCLLWTWYADDCK